MISRLYFSFSVAKPYLFVFGGQGTQQTGMLTTLLKLAQAKKQIQQYSRSLGFDFEQINSTDSNKLINKTKVTQPLLVLSQVLTFRYLTQWKLKTEDFMIGHSVGEYSALCIAESISLGECLELVKKRGELMELYTKQPSGMLTVRFSNNLYYVGDEKKEKVNTDIQAFNLQIACYNTPNNISVAGPLKKLEQLATQFKNNKITCILLPVSTAFHCQILTDMMKPYRSYLQNIHFTKPKANILRNLDTKIYIQDSDIKFGLIQHLIHPVKFYQSVQQIDTNIQCVEIGHRQSMKKFVQETRNKMKR